MKKIYAYLQKLFNRKKVINLFPKQSSVNISELGGNYCQDVC